LLSFFSVFSLVSIPMSPPDQGYAWVDRPIARSPMSLGYRLGLAVVSVMMIFLPAIYLLLCAGMAVGIYYYATNTTFLLGLKQVGIIAYFGPMIAGCVGLAFMIKPLFTRRKQVAAYLTMTRLEQPRLFQFIDEVCARVGAPKPVQVRIDNQVNASASFEHGWWGVITGRLVLTIGLPLTQGLTVGQFGGVLAHEFGHFTQAAAMRFSYAIRSTNDWFSRLIFERDSFDAKLLAWSKRGTYYTILIANIARGFVWLARKILWLLMRAGHAVSAYLMRQMEYDADHYQLEIAGPHHFRETFLLLQLLNAGTQMSTNHLNQLWKDKKLVDNLPLLTQRLYATIPEEAVRQARTAIEADRSAAEWHATHPSHPERIARAAGREETGVLVGEGPAITLFADYRQISEKLTLIEYKERFRLQFTPESLVATDTHLAGHMARVERIKTMAAFFGGLLHEHRLIFPEKDAGEVSTVEEARDLYRQRALALEELRVSTESIGKDIEAARTRRAHAYAATTLLQMGIKIKPSAFGLPNGKRSTIDLAIAEASADIDRQRKELEPAMSLAREKFAYFCRMPECPDWLARVEGNAEWNAWLERIATLKRTLLAIKPINDQLTSCRKSFFLATICVDNFQRAKNKPWANREFEAFAAEFRTALAHIEAIGNSISYPLLDGKSYLHLTGYFVAGNNQPGSIGRFTYLRSLYERYTHLYTEMMLELLEKVTAVEQACANELVAQG